jgi:hypothetical protein
MEAGTLSDLRRCALDLTDIVGAVSSGPATPATDLVFLRRLDEVATALVDAIRHHAEWVAGSRVHDADG